MTLKTWMMAAVTALSLAFAAMAQASSSPANSMRTLQYAAQPGGSVAVRLTFEHAVAASPAAWSTYHPGVYIVLDFPATRSILTREPLEVRQGLLRSLQVVETGGRTRVVIRLNRAAPYELDVKGNEIVVHVRRPH